jgi:hypothetical protein
LRSDVAKFHFRLHEISDDIMQDHLDAFLVINAAGEAHADSVNGFMGSTDKELK